MSKLVIVATAFLVTLGGLFLVDSNKLPEKNTAQIIEALKKSVSPQSSTLLVSATPVKTSLTSKAKTTPNPVLMPTPAVSSPVSAPTLSSTPRLTPTPTSYTPMPIATFLPTPTPSQAPTPTPTPNSTDTVAPNPQEITQTGFINIVSVSSPIKRGSTAQLSIATLPNSQCSIKVVLPSGSQSSAAGLDMKTADSSGSVSWSWKIGGSTTPGDATITLNCSLNGQNFSGSLKMTITSQ